MELAGEINLVENKKAKMDGPRSPTKWAIVAAGFISGDFAISLSMFPADEHQIVAIAARSKEKADTFAEKFNIPNSYGSYEDLANAKDIDIDVVYIGTIPTMLHKLGCLFLNAGYNVVCENPFAMNVSQLTDLIQLAKKKDLFIMEDNQGSLCPAFKTMMTEIKAGNIGNPRFISSNVGVNLRNRAENEWPFIKGCSGMLLMCLGRSALHVVVKVFGREKPIKISASSVYDGKNNGPDLVTVTMIYSQNRMAVLNFSSSLFLSNEIEVYGSGGISGTEIKMNYLYCPEDVSYAPFSKKEPQSFKIPKSEKYNTTFPKGEALMYSAKTVRECLLAGMKESAELPVEDSLFEMQLMDEIRQQIGLVYDADVEQKHVD